MKVKLLKPIKRETKNDIPVGFVLTVANAKGREMIANGEAEQTEQTETQILPEIDEEE